MSPLVGVLLMTDEPETAGTVADSLEENERFAAQGVCRDLEQLSATLKRNPVPAVLVDIDPEPRRILTDLDPIITHHGGTRFIILATARANDLVLEAMQIGARHFLVKQTIASNLSTVLDRLIPNGSPSAGARGVVVTVLSAGGGCGATTIALNVAYELHQLSGEPVLVIDLDCAYGAVAAVLDLSGDYGVGDVLADRERIDSQLISSTAQKHADGLHVLLSPASTNGAIAAPPNYHQLALALAACRQGYRYTVVDAPRVPRDVAVTLAKNSQMTFVACQLTVKDLRQTRGLLRSLIDEGVSAKRIQPLANRYHKRRSMISLDEAAAAIGGFALRCVRNDFRSASRFLNYGQPLCRVARRSPLRRDLRQLAADLFKARDSSSGNIVTVSHE